MTSELLPRVERCIRDRRLLPKGAKLVVGVSGGLDSILLLHVLHELVPSWRWRLHVAHFNHQLRGRASGQDERFVRNVARRLGWPCTVDRESVRGVASRHGVSVEMAARDRRHAFLARTARAVGSRRIVLAHHGNDQVELFLLRMLRGCGLEGLLGMRHTSVSSADPKVQVVRPLLDFPKEELTAEVDRRGLRWREDLSNRETDPLRNRVRVELLPRIQTRFQPGIVSVVLRTMDILRGEAELLREVDRLWTKRSSEVGWSKLPVAVQRRRVLQQLTALCVPSDFDLVERLRRRPGVAWSVGPDRSVRLNCEGRLAVARQAPMRFRPDEVLVDLRGRARSALFGDRVIRWRVIRGGGGTAWQSHKGAGREVFDADRVGASVRLRHWRPGDRFRPIGFGKPAKLQDLLVTNKIPRATRHSLLVAETTDGALFWVEGLRMGHDYRVTDLTHRMLVWSWTVS